MAAIFYLQSLAANIYDSERALNLATNELYSYLEYKIQSLSEDEFQLILRLCVFDVFTMDMAKEILPDIRKEDIFSLEKYSILEPCFCDEFSEGFCIEPNIYQYLQSELLKTNLFDPMNTKSNPSQTLPIQPQNLNMRATTQ